MSQELQVFSGEAGFAVEQVKELQNLLQTSNIKERVGAGGKKLKYVSGDYAIATANRIFGFGKWGYRVLAKGRETIGEKEVYTADIELYVVGCPFPFPGEGVGIAANSTVEQHEKARKEAVTDALKRALRHFGDQFGLSLYNEDNYVEDDEGEIKRVKDVGKPAQPQKRVVDAAPTGSANAPLPSQLRTLFKEIGTTLERAQTAVFKEVYPDDNLTPEQCAKLKMAYDAWKLQREKASAGAGR